MPTSTVNFTANNQSSLITYIRKAREHTEYIATVLVYGTFDGGTITFYLSPDNGTTKIGLTSSAGGTPTAVTANGMFVYTTGVPSTNIDQLQLWATITGAGAPSVTVKNYDNNN